jgi:D-alanyl-D-alanine carboxypeptidase
VTSWIPRLIWLTTLICTAVASSETLSDKQQLQLIVDALLDKHGFPGFSVAIAEGDEIPIVATAGYSNIAEKQRVEPDTAFFIGSVSKNVFAAISLMLVEEDVFDLDDPISKFVEWPRGDEITVRMLLNHTSGIPDYFSADLFRIGADGGPEYFATSHSPEQVLAELAVKTPSFKPGSQQEYSNTNALILGTIIEEVTGRALAEVLNEKVVQPLGLETMYLYGVTTEDRPRARGYTDSTKFGATENLRVDCSHADEALPDSADGSIVTSAGDLLLYHRALRNGALLSDQSWQAMNTVETGLHNGLSYLLGEGQFGPYAGNVGRALGHVAFNVYYLDHDLYVVALYNLGDGQFSIDELVKQWLDTVTGKTR